MPAIKKWHELTDREQEDAIALLHQCRTNALSLSARDKKLMSIAADFLNAHRHKFKK